MSSAASRAVRRAGRAAAALGGTAALARLGVPALAAAVLLALAVLGAACWVLASDARARRVAQILAARRDDVGSVPVPAHPPVPEQASPPPAGKDAAARRFRVTYLRPRQQLPAGLAPGRRPPAR